MTMALVSAWLVKIGGIAYLVEKICAVVAAAIKTTPEG